MQTHAPVKLTGRHTVKAPLEKMPAYYRGGHIVARRERVRRSSHAMALDPFTFVVALDTKVKKKKKTDQMGYHVCVAT